MRGGGGGGGCLNLLDNNEVLDLLRSLQIGENKVWSYNTSKSNGLSCTRWVLV